MNLLLIGGRHAMLPELRRASDYAAAGATVTLLSASRFFYYSG